MAVPALQMTSSQPYSYHALGGSTGAFHKACFSDPPDPWLLAYTTEGAGGAAQDASGWAAGNLEANALYVSLGLVNPRHSG